MNEQQLNPTHSFAIDDVAKYGSIEKAIIMKEIASMQAYKQRTNKNQWVYYSGEALAKKFPYMSGRSIRRWMEELVKDGHLESVVRNKLRYDQTKSYRVTELSTGGQSEPTIGQNDQYVIGQSGQPIPPHSSSFTSHSKKLTFEQKKSYAKACEEDRALAQRQARRATMVNKSSKVSSSIGALLQAKADLIAT